MFRKLRWTKSVNPVPGRLKLAQSITSITGIRSTAVRNKLYPSGTSIDFWEKKRFVISNYPSFCSLLVNNKLASFQFSFSFRRPLSTNGNCKLIMSHCYRCSFAFFSIWPVWMIWSTVANGFKQPLPLTMRYISSLVSIIQNSCVVFDVGTGSATSVSADWFGNNCYAWFAGRYALMSFLSLFCC